MSEQVNSSSPNNSLPKSGDDFADLAALRMPQEFAKNLGVIKLLHKISVGKPDKQVFFQTHPNPSYRMETATIRLKLKNETYLVDPKLWNDLSSEIKHTMLFTSITRQGLLFIWDIPLPGPDGKHHEAYQIQFKAAMDSMGTWMRLSWNEEKREYDLFQAVSNLGEPKWPEKTFEELLRIAFKDRFIKSLEHPAIKELRGEK